MKIPIIAFDEAGNTGQNLLDKTQPVFSLASVKFEQDELQELLSVFDTQSNELHFNRLRKYPKTRMQILNFCNHELIDFSRIKYSLFDKKLSTVAHIIDRLVETVLYDLDIDIYKNGMNIGLTNSLYLMCEKKWNKDLVEIMLSEFIEMMKTKSEASVRKFYSTVGLLYQSSDENGKSLLSLILASKFQLNEIFSGVYKYSIDPTLSAFVVLCDWWKRELNQTFDIIHDQSKQIDFWREMIDFIKNPDLMEEKEVGFDSRKIFYPLKINDLKLVDSELSKLVQVADIVASAVAYPFKEQKLNNENDFAKDLVKTKLFDMQFHSIMFSGKMTPEELGMEQGKGENPLDYLAEMFKKSELKFKIMDLKLK